MSDFTEGRTVQRIPYLRTDRDAHRAEVVVRDFPVDVRLSGFDPEVTTESEGSLIVQPAVLFVDPSIVTHPLDRWRVDGDLYEVIGHPTRIRNDFTGKQFDTEISLRRVTG